MSRIPQEAGQATGGARPEGWALKRPPLGGGSGAARGCATGGGMS